MQSKQIKQLEEMNNQIANIRNLFTITLDYIDSIPTLEKLTENESNIYETCRLAEPQTVLAYQIYVYLHKLEEDTERLMQGLNIK